MPVTSKRDQVVAAAQTLFAQFGLRKVTTDDIAREAHVSKATVYKYFKNKSEIFDQVLAVEAERLLSDVKEAVAKETSATSRLRAHLKTRLRRVREHVNLCRVIQTTWNEYWPNLATVRRDFLAADRELVAGIIRAGVAAGEFKVSDPDAAALALVLGLTSVEFQWSLEEGELKLDELVDVMLDMMVEGIRKR